MCLYLALGCFWLFAAFSDRHRSTAILTTILFAGGLVIGRLISFIVDGQRATRTTIDNLCRDGIGARANRLLGLYASRLIAAVGWRCRQRVRVCLHVQTFCGSHTLEGRGQFGKTAVSMPRVRRRRSAAAGRTSMLIQFFGMRVAPSYLASLNCKDRWSIVHFAAAARYPERDARARPVACIIRRAWRRIPTRSRTKRTNK